MVKEWEKIKETTKGSFRVFSISEVTYKNPYNHQNVHASVIDCDPWVNVIATTRDGNVLLIKQFRFGSNCIELEVPGGTVEPGEDPGKAAARELREETGFEGDEPEPVGRVNPNPAIHRHWCYTFWIKNAEKKGEPRFDGPNERCEIVIEPVTRVKALVKNGTITHALVIDALFWFLLRSTTGLP
ncbi:MAG: NUDIX hydrolase [Candidatus Lokiarchaeota archaeon]|nr:NUDIX hydrolase [Candidatus Lokiarchaeota archaeon]